MSWLLHVLGVDDVSGRWYAFWSGAGSDISEIAIVGALLAIVRKHNCAVGRCWRIGRHKVPGTDHLCCAKHTPGGAPTHAHILDLHRKHVARLTAQASRASAPGAPAERLYDHTRDGI